MKTKEEKEISMKKTAEKIKEMLYKLGQLDGRQKDLIIQNMKTTDYMRGWNDYIEKEGTSEIGINSKIKKMNNFPEEYVLGWNRCYFWCNN